MALERAGLAPSDIGMIVAGGCSPQTLIPAEASLVAKELGIEAPAFDMHSACSTFGTHLHFLSQMGDALPDYVLALTIENNTRVVDYGDRATAVLWGDGCAAAIVSTKHAGRARMLHSQFGGSPEGARDVMVPHAGYFTQNGAKVHKFAIKRMSSLFEGCRAATDRPDELVYVGHQANLTMLQSVAKRCRVPEGRHWFNIDRFGNQGAAGAPAVLSQRWESIEAGARVAAVVVGSGLSWSSVLLQF
jgi:3-oxoacyl-[acyl-carrier-protein] synthase-3